MSSATAMSFDVIHSCCYYLSTKAPCASLSFNNIVYAIKDQMVKNSGVVHI